MKTFCPMVLSPPGVEVLYEGAQPVFADWEAHFAVPVVKTAAAGKSGGTRSIPTRANAGERAARGEEAEGAELEGRSKAPRLFSDAYAVLDFHACRVVVTAQYRECLFSSFRDARLVELENQLIAALQAPRDYRRIFPLLRGERVLQETRGRWCVASHIARATGGICSICRLAVGSTLRCCEPGCTTCFHLSCLWSVGGEVAIKEKGKYYCSNGVNPYVEARCVAHQIVRTAERVET